VDLLQDVVHTVGSSIIQTRKASLLVLLLLGIVGLAACGSGSTNQAAERTSTSNTSSEIPARTTPTQAGSNPGSSFCGALINEQSTAHQLVSALTQSLESADVELTKKSLAAVFNAISNDIAVVEKSMKSAPDNVQAAVTTVNSFITQAQAAIANVANETGAESALASLDYSELRDASTTLADYSTSHCSSATSTTS